MDGTVNLVDGGDYVAVQMWVAVSKAMSWSCDMMGKFFDTVGATADERSPFCRNFSSPGDLRDEFIRYLPRTSQYNDVMGNGIKEATVEPDDTANAPSMVDRIRRFASEMAADGEDEEEDDDNDDVVSASGTSDTPADNVTATDNSQGLMTLFKAIIDTSSVDDILDKVLAASACLERKDNIQGAANFIRKGKSLVQRWLTKPTNAKVPEGNFEAGDTLIERDVVVLVNVKVGRGASASTVALPYCVVDIYDKYYNKGFMSKLKSPVKNWRKEPKPYKLKLRMLEKDAVLVYCDAGLCDNSTFGKESICKIIEEKMIVSVVGKLDAGL